MALITASVSDGNDQDLCFAETLEEYGLGKSTVRDELNVILKDRTGFWIVHDLLDRVVELLSKSAAPTRSFCADDMPPPLSPRLSPRAKIGCSLRLLLIKLRHDGFMRHGLDFPSAIFLDSPLHFGDPPRPHIGIPSGQFIQTRSIDAVRQFFQQIDAILARQG
jgi:hypothetical protein